MAVLPEKRRSTSSALDVIDNGLLIVVGVVVALLLFKLVGFIAGTIWFLGKLALLVGAIYVVVRLVTRRK